MSMPCVRQAMAAPHLACARPADASSPVQCSARFGAPAARDNALRQARSSVGSCGLSSRLRRSCTPQRRVWAEAAGGTTGRTETLPIFPLSIVALPSADVPLQIFEARYRVLFSTLLAGEEGIEEGLVSDDKPWRGSKRFGMCFFDPQSSSLACVGTVLEIQNHQMLEDGRLLVECVGRERFQLQKVVEDRPVLVCTAEYLSEDEDSSEQAITLAKEVGEAFKGVVQLSSKLRDATVPSEIANPTQLATFTPRQLSFWVASLFAPNPYQQQALLEEGNTLTRLGLEKEMLTSTLKYLAAQAALQSVGRSMGGGSEDDPGSSGSD